MTRDEHNELAFNVSGLLKESVGATREHELSEPELRLEKSFVARELRGSAQLLRIVTGILANGEVAAEVTLECARCLEPAETQVPARFEEEFRPSVDVATGIASDVLREGESEEDFSRISPNHILDLTELVRQSLLVELPYSPLCKSDCAGLCPECGANLNSGPCGCETQKTDARLAGLAALLERVDK